MAHTFYVLLMTTVMSESRTTIIAVAIVTRLTDDGAVARIISNPAATDYVAVEPIWQPNAVRGAETPIEEAIGSNLTVSGNEESEREEGTRQSELVTP